MPNRQYRTGTNNTLIICVTVISVFIISGVVMISWAIPDNNAATSRIAILVGILAPTIAAIGNLVKTDKVQDMVENVDSKTDDVLNHVMEAKIQDAVHRVLEAHGVPQTTPVDESLTPEVLDNGSDH